MSLGSVFSLVLRDERFDKFFQASDYLRKRLDRIRAERKQRGEKNVQPTFVDIEHSHTLFIHSAYRPYVSTASEYTRTKASGDGTGSVGPSGGTLVFTLPVFGHFTSDMALHIKFKPIGNATAVAPPTPTTPFLRWCALPGLRLFKNVELKSDAVLIDDYTRDDAVARAKFFVDADELVGWERCVGQQDVREAAYYGNGFTGYLQYSDGFQTPKLFHHGLEMIVPLDFWLCRDASQALLNDLIPNTQRTVTCELAPLAELVKAQIFDPAAPNTLISTPLPFTTLGLEAALYVNGLYVNPEIHDIFASRIGFSLIRVHRRQRNQLQAPVDRFLLDQLKYPAEYLFVGFRARSLATDFDRWWLMGQPRARGPDAALVSPTFVWDPTLMMYKLSARFATEVTSLDPVVSRVGVTAHGIEIYPHLPELFYNAYLPTRYAQNSMVVAPRDSSALLVSFCLYPGKYAPSGYYNLSAGRELYLNYALRDSISDSFEIGDFEMVTSMSALNFLVRRGDHCTLRYSL
jgi:hypothetical protein